VLWLCFSQNGLCERWGTSCVMYNQQQREECGDIILQVGVNFACYEGCQRIQILRHTTAEIYTEIFGRFRKN
jgi:hypothetical protein